jgi:hypothetical protein
VSPRIVFGAQSFSFGEDGVERPGPGKAPTAFRIWRPGVNQTDMGAHIFSAESAKALLEEQELRGNRFSFDVDHLSLNQVAGPEARKAVGWHRLAVRETTAGPELWAVDVEWTDAVRAGLEANPPEWRYFSPAYRLAKNSDEIVQYINCALTNNPATHFVTELAARTLIAAAFGDNTMDFKKIAADMMGDDDEKRKGAKEWLSKASDVEKKAWKAWMKAAFAEDDKDPTDPGGGKEGGEPDKDLKEEKDAAAKAAAAAKADEEKKAAAAAKADEEKKAAARRAAMAEGSVMTVVASLTETSVALATQVQALLAKDSAREAKEKALTDEAKRTEIWATRPDVPDAIKAALNLLPIDKLETSVKELPRILATSSSSASAMTPKVRRDRKDARAAAGRSMTADEQEVFDRIFGRETIVTQATRDPDGGVVLGVFDQATAATRLKALRAERAAEKGEDL